MRFERVETPSPALAEDLARIHAAAFAEEGARGWSPEELRDLHARPSARLWTAQEDQGAALAFLLCDLVLDEAEILTLACAPESRRRGAARGLLNLARKDLKSEGVGIWRLEVAEDNPPALSLYRAFGFQETARRRGYFLRPTGPIDAKIFILSL